MKRLLDYNPLTGVAQYHEYDSLSKKTTIETVQDVTPFLERNKIFRDSDSYSKGGIKNEWWHAASFPVVVQYKWLKDYGIDIYNKDHAQKVNSMLDMAEWKYLKCTNGRIGKRIQWA